MDTLSRIIKGDTQMNSHLIESLLLQRLIHNDINLATLVSNHCTIVHYTKGDIIIEHEDDSDELYFILKGSVDIFIDNKVVAQRKAGQHIGEMSAIDPRENRYGTVKASTTCKVAALSQEALGTIAKSNPDIWRNMAIELAIRLRESPTDTFKNPRDKMKQHLFYLFLTIFAGTALITLLGIANLISIDAFYLKGLYACLIVELVGAVIGMFRTTTFFT